MGGAARRLGSHASALATGEARSSRAFGAQIASATTVTFAAKSALPLLACLLLPAGALAQTTAATAPEDAPAPRSAELRTLRGGTPDRGFDEPAGAFVREGLFAGDYGGDGGSALVLTTDLGARLGIGRDARVRFDWGVAWSRSRVVGTFTTATMSEPYDATLERTEARNADFAVEWAPWLAASSRIVIGIGAAIPVGAIASFGNALNGGMSTAIDAATIDASRTTHAIWLAMNGAWAPWRYQADRIAAFFPLGFHHDFGPLELGIEGAVAVSFPVIGGSGGPESATGLAAELSGAIVPQLTLGARASVSVYSIGGRGEGAQPALEPFLRLDVAPISLTLRGVINLGGSGSTGGAGLRPTPFGLGGPNGVWAIHVGLAVAMDPEPEEL